MIGLGSDKNICFVRMGDEELSVYMILLPLNIHIHPWIPKTCYTFGLDCLFMSSLLGDLEILLTVIGLELSNFWTETYQKGLTMKTSSGVKCTIREAVKNSKIRGMFVINSGPRFLFRALEVPEPRVWKRSFSLTKMNTGIPLISGKYSLRNHLWQLESYFLMRKSEKNSIFSNSS